MKDIIKKGSVIELLNHRDRALECLKKGFELLSEAERAYKEASLEKIGLLSGLSHSDWYSFSSERQGSRLDILTKKLKTKLDTGVWDNLINRSGMINYMDSDTLDNFRKQTSENPPVPTVDNIESTFANLFENRVDTFKKGLVNVFKKLDQKNYRSHSGFSINKRIILTNLVGEFGWRGFGSRTEQLCDIDRIFHLLDGKEPRTREQDVSAMLGLHIKNRVDGVFESDYMTIRLFYGNGNAHVWFVRPDLLEKANNVIAEYYGQTLGREVC